MPSTDFTPTREIPEGTVTVLFTDLVESTRLNQSLGDDRARDVGRQIEQMARQIVDEQRGALIKEMGDGLMAAFASARRAVAAARAMQTEMHRLHREGLDDAVEMRIGLHTGEVITEDGDIHGETVIIAKRIEGLAPPGGILASATVHGVLGTARDELVDQGTTELKGIDAEWQLFLVPVPLPDSEQTALAAHEPTPFVGRVTERGRLRELLERAVAGQGGIALVGGPAGLGKTRLTRETTAMAEQLGMTVLTGHCVDMETPPPYQPVVDQLEHAARANSHDGFRATLGVNAPEVAKLLPSLRQRYDDIPPSPDLTPEQERRYMLHGVGEFIERAARVRPLVLVFEDLHWADESTMLLLRHMASRIPSVPLVVIGTYRDDELEPARPLTNSLSALIRDGGALDLRLRLLTRAEVTEVIASRAGQPPPDDLVGLVMDETQGNPFFVEELYRHLSDDGRLVDDEGRWRTGFGVGETEVPQGVRLLITQRLDRLDPAHRRVLSAAAVLGRTFEFDTLAAVTDTGEDDLFDALEAAERAHLVTEHDDTELARYVFVHEQIRQTLVGELSLPRRQRLHLRVADALAATGSAVDIAHHLLSAGSVAPVARTVDAMVAAARANLDALAFEDVLPHLDHAARLLEGSDDTARSLDVLRLRATALRGAGRVDDALSSLDDALGIAAGADEQITLRLQRVQLLNDQYRAAEGLADLDVLMQEVEASGDGAFRTAVQLARGRSHYILSLDAPDHAETSREAYEAAYAAARAIGDRASMARSLLATTWFSDYWTDYAPTAEANVLEAVELAAEVGDTDLQLDADSARMHRGGVGFDIVESEALLARLEARRDPVKLNAHCFWMMWQYQAHGRFEESVATCDRGIELADLIGSAPVQYGGIKAVSLTELGRFDEVEAAIAQEVTDDDHPFGQAMAAFARGYYLSRLGAWEPAVAMLEETIERARSMSRVWMEQWAASQLAVALARLGADPRSAAISEELERQFVFGQLSRLAKAEVALVAGRHEEAIDHAGRVAERSRDPHVANYVRACDLLSQTHLATGDAQRAADAAASGLSAATAMKFDSIGWRLRKVHALATGISTAEADREFGVLAARIADPELRGWWERQPFAPT